MQREKAKKKCYVTRGRFIYSAGVSIYSVATIDGADPPYPEPAPDEKPMLCYSGRVI